MPPMKRRLLFWSVLGTLLAIAITSTMDASGLTVYSALPLAPLMGVLWLIQRFDRREMGFVGGERSDYLVAVLYPITVMALLFLLAWLAGAVNLSHTDWRKAGLNLLLVSTSTFVVALVTEEGFFRGWLWASLRSGKRTQGGTLVWTSVAFAAWHWSSVVLKTGFAPPPSQVPVFLLNAAVLGALWGLLRWHSGSIIVTSVSHGAWNALAYVLFGFGTRTGAIGIKETGLFGPEIGILGLVLNIGVLLGLWFLYQSRQKGMPLNAERDSS